MNAVAGVPDKDDPQDVPTTAEMDGTTLNIKLGCDATGKLLQFRRCKKRNGIRYGSESGYHGTGSAWLRHLRFNLLAAKMNLSANTPVAIVGTSMLSGSVKKAR
ncbi:hypothetical protein [Enterobacter hormaechei]|uniref:hypothetical protein n=1 Tax=Enterobacter hormaechei TaxID=158836 RepID=UPI001D119CA9|nr:hypothetical protein [Enterobacter hormaechei]UDV36792.1 hypothetical protein LJU43_18770 [Enterobacter hormaechei]